MSLRSSIPGLACACVALADFTDLGHSALDPDDSDSQSRDLGIESLNTARVSRRHDRLWLLCLLFFLSGFPALIYQIVWQRALFTIYGVNIESVTMVVTGFMLGLGLGSLLGGELSKRHLPLVALFGVAELAISFLGLASLRIFHLAALYTAGASQLQTGLISLLLVLLPTL